MGRLFTFVGTIDRRTFALAAIVAFAIKFAIDSSLAALFQVHWTLLSYLSPLGPIGSLSGVPSADPTGRFLGALLATSIPFACFGIALVTRRLRSCGLSQWLTIAFFLPYANLALFALLAVLPPAKPRLAGRANELLDRVPADRFGSAVVAVLVTAVCGFAVLMLGSQILAEYGWGLFVAAPFTQGALAAFLFGARAPRTLVQSIGVALLSVFIAGGFLLLVAVEGVVCVAMALPLATVFAVLGAIFGHELQRRRPRHGAAVSTVFALLLAAPAIMGAGVNAHREPSTFAVTTTVIVDAPPDRVWNRVVSFPQLDPPAELPFRLGIAYPIRAHIDGRGVGAIRYCEFSTGPFVEPITTWDTNHRLAFSVTSNPEPMQEWTPFAKVHPPHLDGYMQSLHGEFLLEALPGNRTRLSGTTWYRHHLWPEQYWRVWSDAIVHQIHQRVLEHVARLAERDGGT